MSRDRLSALRAQQENVDKNPTGAVSWLYPPGLTRTQVPQSGIPVSIPQVPSPIAYVQFKKQQERDPLGLNDDWTYYNSSSKISPFEKDIFAPLDRPLILNNLPPKPINIILEDDMTRFYSEVAAIQESLRKYNENISRVSEAQNRSLNSMDWSTARRSTREVQTLMADTRKLGSDLRLRIRNLHVSPKGEKSRETQIRKQQAALVKFKFIEAIQKYQQVEQQYRHRHKQRLEKQLKIINPEATPEEVQAAVNNTQNDSQVFAQMLQSCNRLGESRTVFREVHERHDDIQKIERTLYELAELFNDMNTLVMTQGEVINGIETVSGDVEKRGALGYNQMNKAVSSARALRKKRKWLCIALALVLLVLFTVSITILIVAATSGNL